MVAFPTRGNIQIFLGRTERERIVKSTSDATLYSDSANTVLNNVKLQPKDHT